VGTRNLSLEERFERLEARLRATERKLEASERRRCHLEANRANLTREVKRLREHNAILQEKVRELTARLNQDSSNSSQPPSADKPWKERRSRKPTGRRPGGQPGHKGTTRKPFPPEQVDHRVPVVPERCGNCHRRLRPQDATGEGRRHQVVEIPPVVAKVFEYVLHESCCPGCSAVTTADLPEGVPAGCVGPRFQAILALLTGRCRISRREAADVSMALFGEKARISVGTVAALERRTAKALKPAYDEALDAIQNAEFVHCDETSWRQANKLAWLWAAVTPMLKVFRVDRRRNREAFRKLLFAFAGILITDRYSVYRIHGILLRQLCWAHIKRNFVALEEQGGKARSLGHSGLKIVKAVFAEWYLFRRGEITRHGLRCRIAPLRKRLDCLLTRHINSPVPKARKIAKDLREYGKALWTFARVEGVEPTNNAAERSLRKAVLWRKGSYGSASKAGSRFAERMLAMSESLRAQDRSILDFLEASIRGRLTGSSRPSLLPSAHVAARLSA
jgi:transposase